MKKIFCVQCSQNIKPRITGGDEIYPHRMDLYLKQFLVCDTCHNYKAYNGKDMPSLIPTPELRRARMEIHAILDPLWKEKKIKRGKAYAYISHRMGYSYHNEELGSLQEAEKAKKIVEQLRDDIERRT